MDIKALLIQDGYRLRQKTSCEYSSPCPFCGGTDRFIVQPQRGSGGRYWCRQCGKKGDAIQYLRDYRKMSFHEACGFMNVELKACRKSLTDQSKNDKTKTAWMPKESIVPIPLWQEEALSFLRESINALWSDEGKKMREWLHRRGLNDSSIAKYHLGFNARDKFYSRQQWGLRSEINIRSNKPKKLWIPQGIVIPCIKEQTIFRLRIRCFRKLTTPRYYIVPGSSSIPMLLGKVNTAYVVVESELDAILLSQETGDFISAMSLGNAQIRPTIETDKKLRKAEIVLVALDSDDAGAKESWKWWTVHYPKSIRWPTPKGKDPGDAYTQEVNLRLWIMSGIYHSQSFTYRII